ncbi:MULTISPECIES: YveK family protein [Shouchella]|uniref:YveK family protein n=1 Tax=Shouchella TaxID=2893057 RepID=UPI0009239500|nr:MULTISPECIES: Wzz/FepE/Etk N-terminal domain-containing protein [Shouchella]MBX0318786.1 capsular biosynthesis protein [Shouchella clausii]MDO7284019.1 Wzz/FepE/Etk N-terminal domain-containing protein [Shouchella clausii]MDO7304115.1 Wzz/FepE/Etk N-terminal domain-containing protein [Shouchella clausii]PAD17519.1 capsular biosynthesis protein [Shouchella clausii]SHL30015.1 Capsular polysaccharide biosynthesis protein [Shouchella rhizosphaerae]
MEETISLKEIFQTLKQRWRLLVAIPFFAMLVSAIISSFVLTPMYERSTQLLVNQAVPEGQLNQQVVRNNLELIDTYSEIIKSPRILNEVIEAEGLDMTYGDLEAAVSVGSQSNSQVVTITVESASPADATLLTNSIATVFQEQIPDIMSIDNVSILSEAEIGEDPTPVSPKPLLNIAIAFVVGLMAAVGLAFLLEYLDTTIKTEKDIENIIDLPVLGAVSNMDSVDAAAKKTS